MEDKLQEEIDQCRLLQANLQNRGGYFVKDPSEQMQISPDHFYITLSDIKNIESKATVIWKFWKQVNTLYIDAIDKKVSNYDKILWSVEEAISNEHITLQRKLAKAIKNQYPLLARVDATSIWNVVEIQERIGGMGLMESWTDAIRSIYGLEGVIGNPYGLVDTFSSVIASSTNNKNAHVLLICPKGYEDEQNYLKDKLIEKGFSVKIVKKSTFFTEILIKNNKVYDKGTNKRIDFIYRREIDMSDIAREAIGRQLLESYLFGNVVIEPPPNIIYDCKSPMAWVHDEKYLEYFTDDVKQLVTPTYLLPKGLNTKFNFMGEKKTLQDLKNKRDYILKYAGSDIRRGFGGRSVYNSRSGWKIINFILEDIARGKPWIVQPKDKTRYKTRIFNGKSIIEEDLAARIMLYYVRDPVNRNCSFFYGNCTNRKHWKAVGSKDSVFQEVRLKK